MAHITRGAHLVTPLAQEQLNCLNWDIWYDFFGIPQVDDRGVCALCVGGWLGIRSFKVGGDCFVILFDWR